VPVASIVRLARWLGPWADQARTPTGLDVRDEVIAGLRVRTYRGPRPTSAVFVAPGLHYAGPDDPRMDRFCRVLAYAGHHVVAPFVPDFLALKPRGQAVVDFVRVFDAIAWERAPIVFSISFGSLLAFALAAERPDRIARVICFGGYHDLPSTLHFALTGEVRSSGRVANRDPLNQPVVIGNLIDDAALVAHWRRYVERTWGRPEMKARAAFTAVAQELVREVPEELRERYLVGIGVLPGARAWMERAFASFDGRALDPAPYLARIRAPVDLVHGTDDDVIPFEHAHALAAKLPHARVHVTGMYGHTGAALPSARAIIRELATMLRVLRAMAA